MSDHDRGAYTPPTDAPLSFDARQPVRGSRPVPFTLIISVLLLAGLVVALFLFYRSGVRSAGEAPQVVGAPVGDLKSEATPEAQPTDPAAGLQIYRSEDGSSSEVAQPSFVPPPETPQPRPAPVVVAPPAAAPTTPVGKAQALAPAAPAAAPKAAPAPVASAPAPKTTPPPAPKAVPAPAPVPTAKASGGAAVQIGAFSSQALADKGWGDAVSVSPGLAAGKGKSVERVERDGSTFYRTTVTGFGSRADATAFCSALKAAGKSCFVR